MSDVDTEPEETTYVPKRMTLDPRLLNPPFYDQSIAYIQQMREERDRAPLGVQSTVQLCMNENLLTWPTARRFRLPNYVLNNTLLIEGKFQPWERDYVSFDIGTDDQLNTNSSLCHISFQGRDKTDGSPDYKYIQTFKLNGNYYQPNNADYNLRFSKDNWIDKVHGVFSLKVVIDRFGIYSYLNNTFLKYTNWAHNTNYTTMEELKRDLYVQVNPLSDGGLRSNLTVSMAWGVVEGLNPGAYTDGYSARYAYLARHPNVV